jgi:hypothetical protein
VYHAIENNFGESRKKESCGRKKKILTDEEENIKYLTLLMEIEI